ncbi:hypothetical protein WN944_022290 [Citrus x changshan-huyou]|uniref:Uncharacterized protein n=1 Tax=Citrus x changshan-huyou TaxID=2935761 RepID=A0AAP0N0L2_9ROSI
MQLEAVEKPFETEMWRLLFIQKSHVTVASGLPVTDKRQAEFGAVSTRTKTAYRIPNPASRLGKIQNFALTPWKGLDSEILELGSLGGVDVGGDCRTTGGVQLDDTLIVENLHIKKVFLEKELTEANMKPLEACNECNSN